MGLSRHIQYTRLKYFIIMPYFLILISVKRKTCQYIERDWKTADEISFPMDTTKFLSFFSSSCPHLKHLSECQY